MSGFALLLKVQNYLNTPLNQHFKHFKGLKSTFKVLLNVTLEVTD